MRWMILVGHDEKGSKTLPPEEHRKLFGAYQKYVTDLRAAGVYLSGEALQSSDKGARLASEGRPVQATLEALARKFGLWVSGQVNVVRKGTAGPAEIRDMMDRIRAANPAALGPFRVVGKADFATGARGLPKSNMIAFDLEGGSRVIARPSGTEPKAKFYFDVNDRIGDGEALDSAESRARGRMKALSDAFVALAGV